jgi:hypothetical protein
MHRKRWHFSMRVNPQIGFAFVLTLRQANELSFVRCSDFFKNDMRDD